MLAVLLDCVVIKMRGPVFWNFGRPRHEGSVFVVVVMNITPGQDFGSAAQAFWGT